jgi:hypothetical protein
MKLNLPKRTDWYRRVKILSSLSLLLFLSFNAVCAEVNRKTEFSNSRKTDTLTIHGKVTDKLGLPLAGASVLLKGTKIGTITNGSGQYAIALPGRDGILVYRFIGYTAKEEEVLGRTTINVSLSEDDSKLKEVVVVGYATRDKASVTGAISQIDNKAYSTLQWTWFSGQNRCNGVFNRSTGFGTGV